MNEVCGQTLRFSADPRALKQIRRRVHETALASGCNAKVAAELVLAVNEACMNIIQHAYKGDCSGAIVLEILNNGSELEFHLTDFAAPVDLAAIKPRPLDEIRPGGLGTHFIGSIMDEYVYGHLAGECGNYLRMRKKIR